MQTLQKSTVNDLNYRKKKKKKVRLTSFCFREQASRSVCVYACVCVCIYSPLYILSIASLSEIHSFLPAL